MGLRLNVRSLRLGFLTYKAMVIRPARKGWSEDGVYEKGPSAVPGGEQLCGSQALLLLPVFDMSLFFNLP